MAAQEEGDREVRTRCLSWDAAPGGSWVADRGDGKPAWLCARHLALRYLDAPSMVGCCDYPHGPDPWVPVHYVEDHYECADGHEVVLVLEAP